MMKLIGFNEHYIEKIDFTFISQEEMDNFVNEDDEEGNVQINEAVEIGLAEGFRKAKITAEVQFLDLEALRKIELTIIGFFEVDNENIDDGRVVTDFVYNEGWPILKQYVNPALTTILNISNTGLLEI